MHHAIVKAFDTRGREKAAGHVEAWHWWVPRPEDVARYATHEVRVVGVHVHLVSVSPPQVLHLATCEAHDDIVEQGMAHENDYLNHEAEGDLKQS